MTSALVCQKRLICHRTKTLMLPDKIELSTSPFVTLTLSRPPVARVTS